MTALTSFAKLFFAVVILQFFHATIAITTRVQPKDLEVVVGSTVILTCSADNIGAHSIYWYRQTRRSYLTKNTKVYHQVGSLVDFYLRISVVGDTARGEFNLRIVNVTYEDADRYSCVYFQESRYVTESRAGELKVYEAPVKGFPKCNMLPDTALGPGIRVTIKCLSQRSTGSPNSRLDWHRWFEMLPGTFEQGNNPKASYATILTEHDNGAVFTCVESSPVLEVPRTCNVTPFLIPTNVTVVSIHGSSTSKSARKRPNSIAVGREALFSCQAVAIPPVSNYTWFLGDELVKESSKTSIENNGEQLRIRDVQLSDNGSMVECRALNSAMIEGSGETMLEVERAIRSAQASGSPHFATSDIGTIIGPSVGLIIIISIVIYLVVRLRNKKLSHRRGSDFQEPVNRSIRPDIVPITETTIVVTDEVSNPEPEETEPLSLRRVTICSTPHAAIVEHLKEQGNSTEGDVDKAIRTSDKTASRVLMVRRLSSATSDTSENKDQDVNVSQLYTKPLKRGIKKSEIGFPISVSSETDSIYVNCPNTNSVHV